MIKRSLILACLALTVISCGLFDSVKKTSEPQPQYIVVTATPEIASLPPEAPVAAPTDAPAPSGETETITDPVNATLTLIYGPYADTLIKQDSTKTAGWCAEVDVRDFKAEVTFTALPGFQNYTNSFAMYFRDTGEPNDQYRVEIQYDRWYLVNVRKGDFIDVNLGNLSIKWADTSPKRITLYAVGDTGYLYFNGYFIMKLDLSARQDSGNVCVVASEWQSDSYGQISKFEDFTVWELTPNN